MTEASDQRVEKFEIIKVRLDILQLGALVEEKKHTKSMGKVVIRDYVVVLADCLDEQSYRIGLQFLTD